MRQLAAIALDRTLAGRQPLGAILEPLAADLEERDRRLLRELVAGTLRWLRRLDAVIEDASSRPLARVDGELLSPLRLGVYQLLFLNRVPAHAAVNESVADARRRRRAGAGFVNAVLRRVAARPRLEEWPLDIEDPVEQLAVATSHPTTMVARWLGNFGEERTRAVLAANNRPRPTGLLAFEDRGGRRVLAERLAAEGVVTAPATLSPRGLVLRDGDPLAGDAFRQGLFYVQDEASQAAAWLPPPRAGERILDAAAAPGGKGFALWAWEAAVRPVLADRSPARLGRLRRNLARLDRVAPLVVADAARPPFTAGFDRVILDLPCSGTGTLRKHPELKWRFDLDALDRLAAKADQMLAGGANLVRPGGLLIAVTCSIEPEENEAVVERLLAGRPELELLPFEGLLPESLVPGVEGRGRWRVLPGGDHDGFTVHTLRRR